MGNAQIENANASVFAVTSNTCAVVPAFGNCSIGVTLLATAAGSPQIVPMPGTGLAQVNLTPASFEFGGWLVGTSSIDNTKPSLQGDCAGRLHPHISPSVGISSVLQPVLSRSARKCGDTCVCAHDLDSDGPLPLTAARRKRCRPRERERRSEETRWDLNPWRGMQFIVATLQLLVDQCLVSK